MAPVIGLDWWERRRLKLTEKNGGSTSGIVFTKRDGRVRAVFYRQGRLGLPGKYHFPHVRSALLGQ
jgi:hypothetical protein